MSVRQELDTVPDRRLHRDFDERHRVVVGVFEPLIILKSGFHAALALEHLLRILHIIPKTVLSSLFFDFDQFSLNLFDAEGIGQIVDLRFQGKQSQTKFFEFQHKR